MIKEILEKVTSMMEKYPIYLVGGACRSYLIGDEIKDYDFCTPAEPDEIEKLIKASGRRAYLIGKRYGTISCKIEIDGVYHMVEITCFRSEKYESGNRKPEVKYVKSLHEDLSRRDFTINSIAIRLCKGNLRIIDPFNGQEDLKNGIIKAVGIPKQRFKEDSLRILRAIRFACRFNFKIEEKTLKKMESGSIQILNISKERWCMELDKILQTNNVRLGLELLWDTRLFNYMIPELSLQRGYDQNSQYHNFTLDEHTIKVVEAVRKDTDDLNMLWGSLLHDISKPFVRTDKPVIITNEYGLSGIAKDETKSNYIGHEILGAEMVDRIATHLKWSNERREAVVDLVRNHLNEDSPLRKYDNRGKK